MKAIFAGLSALLIVGACTADQGYDSFRQECPHVKEYPSIFAASDDLASVKTKVTDRLAIIGLSAEWSDSWTAEDLPRLERLASIVVPSLEKYPPSWFTEVDLRSILFTKDLWVDGQLRKAMPDPANHRLYYADNNDLICLAGMEERVHHEFYHMIEDHFYGSTFYHDPQWMSMNPQSFEYGPGGYDAYNQGPDWQNLGHPDQALVSMYAAYAAEEDKAEVYGWMMTEGYAKRVKNWIAEDSLLRTKVAYMLDFLNEKSHGALNADFFNRIARIRHRRF